MKRPFVASHYRTDGVLPVVRRFLNLVSSDLLNRSKGPIGPVLDAGKLKNALKKNRRSFAD